MHLGEQAPELDVTEWIGPSQQLADLRGQVVLVKTFQMLCPGCVAYGLPQAKRVQQTFPDVVVVGLHTVFEHHEAMGPTSLRAFLSEYRIGFPVGIDRHDGDLVPVTMRRYGLQGTPSTMLIDRAGRLVVSEFGEVDDLALGAQIGLLLAQSVESMTPGTSSGPTCRPGADCT